MILHWSICLLSYAIRVRVFVCELAVGHRVLHVLKHSCPTQRASDLRFGVAWCVAAPAALIGASYFFELAVAAAISLFGLNSCAALSTVVGVLVEVPVMLSVVSIVKKTRPWYEPRVPA